LPRRSSTLDPVRKERYAGTSGRTHGETKETSPARKAIPTVRCALATPFMFFYATLVYLPQHQSHRDPPGTAEYPLVRHLVPGWFHRGLPVDEPAGRAAPLGPGAGADSGLPGLRAGRRARGRPHVLRDQ